MTFEKFENRHSKVEERITVTKSNTIGFPARFYDDNNIKNYKTVELFWDSDSKEIAIKFTNEPAEKKSGFSIGKSKEGYGGSVVARSFFKHYKIDLNKVHAKYDWKKINLEGVGEVYVIKLVEK